MYKKMQVARAGGCLRRWSNMPHRRTANQIRREFIDYFVDRDHVFVRSSPVSLLTDRSVAFVNAGMNQFKGVLLNYYDPPAPKVVNSQKCVRVGGKHNDLNIVGTDTYHHTFFEMLGSWSFDNYYKRDACQYAWDLLIGPYGIKKEFLYVTYFGGDHSLNLEPDLECKDIWRSLGVPEDKILPFGTQDNFWEMGNSGPCGPCTEIHVDHKMRSQNQSANVNKGYADLTELWNLVFIEYERCTDGTVVPLPKHHVDTGMGFERLVALLQGKSSNYDTDLFQPLFDTIQKCSKVPQYKGLFGSDDENGIDYGYRVMADHARMIAVTLADDMIPQEHPKLRRILRRAVDMSENTFKEEDLLPQLMYTVAESLGDFYPELQNNFKQIQKVIRFEQNSYRVLKEAAGKDWRKLVKTRPKLSLITEWTSAGLVEGYKYLQSKLTSMQKNSVLPGDVGYTLYETYGLSLDTIAQLAEVETLKFDRTLFDNEFEEARKRSRQEVMDDTNKKLSESTIELYEINRVPPTDDSYKYKYVWTGSCYEFPPIQSRLTAVIKDDDDNIIAVVLDKTPFFSREERQERHCPDKGSIHIKDLVLNVQMAKKICNRVIHYIDRVKDSQETVQVGTECTISVDPNVRLAKMRHYTGAHLLIAALKPVCDVARERYMTVREHDLTLKFYSFGEKLTLENLNFIEHLINEAINESIPVTTEVLNSLQLLAQDDIAKSTGAIIPLTGIRLVHINGNVLKSKQISQEVHVHNTNELIHFCLLNYTHNSNQHGTINGVFGPSALLARKTGNDLLMEISKLEYDCKNRNVENKAIHVQRVRQLLGDINKGKTLQLPYVERANCLNRLQHLSRDLTRSPRKKGDRVSQKDSI